MNERFSPNRSWPSQEPRAATTARARGVALVGPALKPGQVEVNGRIGWRKQHVADNRRFRLAALNWIAARLALEPLRAPAARPAAQTCRLERAMIDQLSALGVRVPAILEAGDTHLVLSDLGPTLADCCRSEPDPERRQHLLQLGFAAVLDLHRRGGHLSQAFARNLTVDGDRIGFIDFEEDPLEVMSLHAAMARDVLFYVHSTARFLLDQPARFRAMLDAHLEAESPEVAGHVLRVARRLAWLAPLARLIGGRSRAVAEALSQLAQSRRHLAG